MGPSHESPRLILGTMTFVIDPKRTVLSGLATPPQSPSRPLTDLFKSYGHCEIDTTQCQIEEDTEGRVLGQISDLTKFTVATSIVTTGPLIDTYDNIHRNFQKALDALNTDSVDLLYLTCGSDLILGSSEECIRAVDELYMRGLIKEFGLSDFTPAQVNEFSEIAKAKNYIRPTVYRGTFSPQVRDDREAILPILNKHNIRYYGRSSLGNANDFSDPMMELGIVADQEQITLASATLRWLKHHAGLGSQDGIILDVLSFKELAQNLEAWDQGALTPPLVDQFESTWRDIQNERTDIRSEAL